VPARRRAPHPSGVSEPAGSHHGDEAVPAPSRENRRMASSPRPTGDHRRRGPRRGRRPAGGAGPGALVTDAGPDLPGVPPPPLGDPGRGGDVRHDRGRLPGPALRRGRFRQRVGARAPRVPGAWSPCRERARAVDDLCSSVDALGDLWLSYFATTIGGATSDELPGHRGPRAHR
jgi:hypothetical protein